MNAETEMIVVGVDGSEDSNRALEWAINEARLRGARLRLVAAWHIPLSVYSGPGYIPAVGRRETFEEIAKEATDLALKRARDTGVEVDAVVCEGQAAEVLLEEATGADTHSRALNLIRPAFTSAYTRT